MGNLPFDCSGSSNQPCTSNPSLFHQMLCTRAGMRNCALIAVKFRPCPMGPTAISGASVNVCRSEAITPVGQATEAYLPWLLNDSAPLHSTRAAAARRPVPRSASCALSPASNCACKRPSQPQASAVADARIPGVMSVAGPPSSGSVYTSPPVEPKSLMIPAMKATVAPSRDTVGAAICCRMSVGP